VTPNTDKSMDKKILSFSKRGPAPPDRPPPTEGRIRVVVTYDFATRELAMRDFVQIRGGKDAEKWMINPLPQMFGIPWETD
jgi:hypothetical protein